jgi:hypothetical protein
MTAAARKALHYRPDLMNLASLSSLVQTHRPFFDRSIESRSFCNATDCVPFASPGIDSGDGATIAHQAACALASLLQVADEVPLSLLPANSTAGNATLSSTVAETQPAIESAIATFLPKLQLIAQYGLATSPCGEANDTSATCDDYRCFTEAADALLNVVARRCETPNLPTTWWMDAAAFVPVLVARVYGNDPVVSTAGTATSFGGNTFDGTAVLAAVNATSIQATAGAFGFSVAIPDDSVTAYAIAYGHGILPPPGAPVSANGASSMAAALFLVKDNGERTFFLVVTCKRFKVEWPTCGKLEDPTSTCFKSSNSAVTFSD